MASGQQRPAPGPAQPAAGPATSPLGSVEPWVLAARPRTLPAAAVPVLLGSALAAEAGCFDPLAAGLCLLFALLIQVGTNYANDYYDARHGADTSARIGPTRMVASGRVAPRSMYRAMVLTFALAFAAGLGLLPFGGWGLLVIGLLSIACGVAYTGGPYPLGYHGWGEVFVFLFFGLVAVGATFFVQAGGFSLAGPAEGVLSDRSAPATRISYVIPAFLLGAGSGALATAILLVNNYRDAPTDVRAGKRTLAVRWGRPFAFGAYATMHGLALAVPPALWVLGFSPAAVAPLLLGPVAFGLVRRLGRAQSAADFQAVLAGTSAYFLAYGALLSLGLVL